MGEVMTNEEAIDILENGCGDIVTYSIALTHAIEHMKRFTWREIETAPRDGVTKALYGCYKNGNWYIQITARGKGVGGLHVNVPTGFRSYTGATHWMPLPPAPESEE